MGTKGSFVPVGPVTTDRLPKSTSVLCLGHGRGAVTMPRGSRLKRRWNASFSSEWTLLPTAPIDIVSARQVVSAALS